MHSFLASTTLSQGEDMEQKSFIANVMKVRLFYALIIAMLENMEPKRRLQKSCLEK